MAIFVRCIDNRHRVMRTNAGFDFDFMYGMPTEMMENEWISYHDGFANATLMSKTNSWYMGSNVPGKQRRMLSFAGGVGTYHQKCEELAIRGYPGFVMH